MNLETLKNEWVDNPEYHKHIHEYFCSLVNDDEYLKSHRDWVEKNVFGFGERSFWWLWKLICEELPHDAKIMEIGVFKGATLSLWQTLPCLPGNITYGVTPLDGTGLGWKGEDYRQHIIHIHHHFQQEMPIIFEGLSTNIGIIEQCKRVAPFDCIYVDGSHKYDDVISDLYNYAPMVKVGGYLVLDDACQDMHMPFGYFQGIDEVTNAVLDYMSKNSEQWEFITNVVHLRVYKRI